jgi:hypothetical protein
MKPSHMLVNLVVVVGAIFVYDLLRGDRAPAERDAAATDAFHSIADEDLPPIELKGTADEILAARNARRIAVLERKLASLGTASGSARGASSSPGGTYSDSPAARVPALDPNDVVNTRHPVFHDGTLHTIQAYLGEINRRKVQTRQRNRYVGTLGALKLESNERQQEELVAESLKFGERARALVTRKWSPDEAGRDARRAAIKDLQEEYVSFVKGLVAPADVKKILDSRIPRGMGFSTGTARRGERGDR